MSNTLERNSADNNVSGARQNSGTGGSGVPNPHQLGSVLKKSDLNVGIRERSSHPKLTNPGNVYQIFFFFCFCDRFSENSLHLRV